MWRIGFDENDEAAVDHFQEELCNAVEASTVVQIAGEKPVAPRNEIADVLASGIKMKLTTVAVEGSRATTSRFRVCWHATEGASQQPPAI